MFFFLVVILGVVTVQFPDGNQCPTIFGNSWSMNFSKLTKLLSVEVELVKIIYSGCGPFGPARSATAWSMRDAVHV